MKESGATPHLRYRCSNSPENGVMHALRFSTSFKHDRIITQVPKGEFPQFPRCCPLKFVQFATNLLLIHPIHLIHPSSWCASVVLTDVQILKEQGAMHITMILHINQTRKTHNPKFRSENENYPNSFFATPRWAWISLASSTMRTPYGKSPRIHLDSQLRIRSLA